MITPAFSEEAHGDASVGLMRIVIVVSEPGDEIEDRVVSALAASKLFSLRVTALPVAFEMPRMSWLDRVYSRADAVAFGGRARGPGALPPTAVERAEPRTLASACGAAAILDLTCGLIGPAETSRVPVIMLRFEGRTPAALALAVRSRIGTAHGTLDARVSIRDSSGPRDLYRAQCFLDHRSVLRSVDLVINKVPMLLQGSLRRVGMPLEPVAPLAPNQEAQRSASRLLSGLAGSIVKRLLQREQWKILLYRDATPELLARPWVTLAPDASAFWADPFVVAHERGVTVFFEELPFSTGKGRISAIDLDHDGRAGPMKVILDLPWHLSYPFLFEWEGKRYMIPESSAREVVDLYECVEFPHEWRHVKRLMEGVRLADVTLIPWQGRWWMFAAHGGLGASNYDELHLYWADTPMGPWSPHALNPVRIDAGSARPAGAMFMAGDRIVRPAQDCRERYGDGVVFQEVLVLDEERFEERTLHRLEAGGLAPGVGYHTFNSAGRYAAIDAVAPVARMRP